MQWRNANYYLKPEQFGSSAHLQRQNFHDCIISTWITRSRLRGRGFQRELGAHNGATRKSTLKYVSENRFPLSDTETTTAMETTIEGRKDATATESSDATVGVGANNSPNGANEAHKRLLMTLVAQFPQRCTQMVLGWWFPQYKRGASATTATSATTETKTRALGDHNKGCVGPTLVRGSSSPT